MGAKEPIDDGAPILAFPDGPAFERWLGEHHGHRPGVWVKVAKRASGLASVTEAELVDIGLCWGWISGQRKGLEETHYLQKYVPRRPRSRWSQVNVRKVEQLTAAGLMRPPGLAEVEAARADGRWDAAYVSQKDFTEPDDLRAALDAAPPARAAYDALGRSMQYAVVLDVVTARNERTRAGRVAPAVERLATPG